MKFLCDNCKAKYQIADEKVAGKTVRMKCRKCGHQIEVRAAITETSVSMAPPQNDSAPPRPLAGGGLAAAQPGRPRPGTPSFAPEGAGALAGAFQRTVQQDAPVAISVQEAPAAHELSVTDEWYVAINGVPVGPVRMSELRRKAASGSVTEDSLAWQEGLEEWRPVRSLPDLAAIVREAAQGNRPSLISPPLAEAPKPPPAPRAKPGTPSGPPPSPRRDAVPMTERIDGARPQAPAAGRNNVVPLHGRGGAAPAFEEHAPMTAPLAPAAARAPSPSFAPGVSPGVSMAPKPQVPSQAPRPPTPAPFAATALAPLAPVDPFARVTPAPSPAADPFAVPDPFALRAPMAAPSTSSGPIVPASMSLAPPVALGAPSKKGVPLWFWPVMVFVLGFGGVAAWFVFKEPPPAVERVVIQQVPAPVAAPQAAPPPVTTDTVEPAPSASAGSPKPATGGARVAQAPASTAGGAAATGNRTADLSGLLGGAGGPTVGGGGAGGGAAGGGLDSATVQRIVRERSPAVKRACWERGGGDQKSSAKVTVAITVGPSGRVESAQASGDDPVIAKCIENQVRGWTFPAPGSQTTINVPFVFVRQ